MDKHVDEIMKYVPGLLGLNILDLGAGRGKFMFEILKRGGKVTGVEPYDEYMRMIQERGREIGLNPVVIQAAGEKLPFTDREFGFVNMSEVLEHVVNPRKVMGEVNRVLDLSGSAYVSVPNRFSMKDQHFNMYFINWLPRKWAAKIVYKLNTSRDYSKNNGMQRLEDMHYFTYRKAKKFFEAAGFNAEDIREIKIQNRFKNAFARYAALAAYRSIRFFYFDSFHFLLRKR